LNIILINIPNHLIFRGRHVELKRPLTKIQINPTLSFDSIFNTSPAHWRAQGCYESKPLPHSGMLKSLPLFTGCYGDALALILFRLVGDCLGNPATESLVDILLTVLCNISV
jgi:hypothetical protein